MTNFSIPLGHMGSHFLSLRFYFNDGLLFGRRCLSSRRDRWAFDFGFIALIYEHLT